MHWIVHDNYGPLFWFSFTLFFLILFLSYFILFCAINVSTTVWRATARHFEIFHAIEGKKKKDLIFIHYGNCLLKGYTANSDRLGLCLFQKVSRAWQSIDSWGLRDFLMQNFQLTCQTEKMSKVLTRYS